MAATRSISTVKAWDKNGKVCQCDPRQYKTLAKSGYSLTDPALDAKPSLSADPSPAKVKQKTAVNKPANK